MANWMKYTLVPISLVLLLAVSVPVSGEAVNHATGDTLVYTIMISGADQQFSEEMASTVQHHLGRVESYYESRAPEGTNLDFHFTYKEATIDYSGEYGDFNNEDRDTSYVGESIRQLGYSGNNNYAAIQSLVESKKSEGHDNVAVVFIAPAEGRSFARRMGDVEYTTVFYYESNDAISSLLDLDDTPSAVYAHELGHLFGATDEYQETGNTGYGDLHGWGVPPMEDIYPSFNYQTGPSVEESLMIHEGFFDSLGWFSISTPISDWARGAIGWRDFDLDGTLDYRDESIPVEFPTDRLPILNAGSEVGSYVEYTDFDGTNAFAAYDDLSVVDNEVGFSLESPDGTLVDTADGYANNTEVVTADLDARVDDAEKPGNWTINFLYGTQDAAEYTVTVIAPFLETEQTNLEIGRIQVGQTESVSSTIRNTGRMDLDLDSDDTDLVETSGDTTVGPGGSTDYGFSVTPQERGEIEETLDLSTNDPRQETVTFTLNGVAYIIRTLQATAPTTSKVDDQVPVDIGYQEAENTPTSYDITVQRNGEDVTNQDFISLTEEPGQAGLQFGKYGDYTITVDRQDTDTIEYQEDQTTLTIERLQKTYQLDAQISQQTVKTGETITITPTVNGEEVTAELLKDGTSQGTADSFTISFEEAGNHTVTLQKGQITTDREIRDYLEKEIETQVQERSFFGKIGIWLRNLW